MADPEETPPWLAALPSPLDAVPDMRAAAKWLAAGAGAAGTALVGAGPLAGIGHIRTVEAATLAASGLVISIAGVILVLRATSEVLTPPLTTLASLDEPDMAELRQRMDRDPAAYFGPFGTSVDQLRQGLRLHGAAASNLARLCAGESDAARKAALQSALRDARANVALAETLLRRLAELLHAWRVRQALRRAQRVTLLAMIGVAVGAALFLFSTGQAGRATANPGPSPSASASR